MTVTQGGRRFQGIQSGLERANKGKAKPVWYSDLWVLLSAVSVSQRFFGECLQPLWVYAFLSGFDKQWVSFAHSPAFSVQSEWRRRGKEGEGKGRGEERKKKERVSWTGLRGRDRRKKRCGRRQEVWGGIYTKQQRAYNYASNRIPQYITTEISQPTYFEQIFWWFKWTAAKVCLVQMFPLA